MKTSQPTNRLPLAAAVAVIAGLLTGALWSSQPASTDSVAVQRPQTVVDQTIPSITITAKRMSKAEKERMARESTDPSVPHLTVIGYRSSNPTVLSRAL